ncbi:AbrB/MazE/SpoVT family DNA-binding domain-containing protein [Candidatus Woesearchaeota archaeon]|nr:AbrB/MazE/SpoVT family DNA-binding domain-containing protein [Candidatus Woesearchaeota archaeon]
MVKLQYDNNKQYKVTLPKALIDAKGWKKGDEIKIELDVQGNLVLKRAVSKAGSSKV